MNNPVAPLLLSHGDRNMLTKWAHSVTAPHRVVTRAKALLMAGDGVANTRIAATLGIGRPTVLNWRGRFLIDGLDSVGEVRPGRGRKPEITAPEHGRQIQDCRGSSAASVATRPQRRSS